jgi:sensor histidine kinase regulating citrate/malate metabolism
LLAGLSCPAPPDVAEIVHDPNREQLHLLCEDDGAGIAKASLERVFDKGFSTKSRDTNYGIGLHWCANAVAALGGRIWGDQRWSRLRCVHAFDAPVAESRRNKSS